MRGPCYRRTPRHTTHRKDLPAQVRITRPQHPFDGTTLAVFGRRRYQGKPHLVLILPDGSRSLIPTEWTDLASSPPGSLAGPKLNTPLGCATDLLHARAVVDALLNRHAPSDGNGEKSVREESNHRATQSAFSRLPSSGSPSLGNVGERAKNAGDRSSGTTDRPSNLSPSKRGERS